MCFFQGEDGRRGLVRSRGLGVVYRRQVCVCVRGVCVCGVWCVSGVVCACVCVCVLRCFLLALLLALLPCRVALVARVPRWVLVVRNCGSGGLVSGLF